MSNYTSKAKRQGDYFLRNNCSPCGIYEIPLIKRCDIDISELLLIGCDQTRANESDIRRCGTVHFFSDDYKIDKYYNHPERYLRRLAQYKNLLTPDYSLYTDLPIAIQINNTFRNRWCGAFWQEYGLRVVPTISWSTEASYDFCFDGVEYGSAVAVSTVGNLLAKSEFLAGYNAMVERINPSQVLCFGKAFAEMGANVYSYDYLKNTGRAK